MFEIDELLAGSKRRTDTALEFRLAFKGSVNLSTDTRLRIC
jgi:hypothetical protein